MANPQTENSLRRYNVFKLPYSFLERLGVSPPSVVFWHNRYKVLRAVVCFYTIQVVNYISFWQKFPIGLLPNNNMFKNIVCAAYFKSPMMWLFSDNTNIAARSRIANPAAFPVRSPFPTIPFTRTFITQAGWRSPPMNKLAALLTPLVDFNFPLPVPLRPFRHTRLVNPHPYSNILPNQSQYL